MRLARLAPLAFAAVTCTLPACGDDAPGPSADALPADEIEAIPFSTTKVLGASNLSNLTASPDGTLSFRSAPAPLENIAVGNVIVAGLSPATPQGLLRVVTDVRRSGTTLELSTMHAPLQLAFRKLHVKLERDVASLAAAGAVENHDVRPRTLRPRGEVIGLDAAAAVPLDFLLFDGDDDPSTTNDQIGIKGSLGGGIRFGLSVDVDWDDVFDLPQAVQDCVASLTKIIVGKLPDCTIEALLPEVKVGFHADPHMNANVKVEGSASLSYEKAFDLATITLPPIAIGPLVFVPSADITAKVEGSAAAGFKIGARGGITFTSGVEISSKHLTSPNLQPIGIKDANFEADETQVTLSGRAKASVGARLNVQLYGIVGPYVEASAYTEVKADSKLNPCWDLHIGLDGALGIKVNTPVLPVLGSVKLLDWHSPPFNAIDQVLASGGCTPVPKGPPLPPGSGPDANALATPTFTPWTRTWGTTGEDGAVKAVIQDDRNWTDLSLAIDHRYVTVGTRTDTIAKFDDDGGLLWSRRYRREAPSPFMRLTRVAHTADAAMMVLTEANDTEGPSLLKIGQAGGVYFRKTLALPRDAGCTFQPTHLVRDSGSGFYVLGTCASGDKSAVVHVDADASVRSVRIFGEPGNVRTIKATAISVSGDDVIVLGTGSTVTDGATMFALRFGDSGGPAWANRYVGRDGYKDLLPTSARTDRDDGVTVAGSAADHRVGLVARIKKDGTLAFSNLPGLGTYSSTPLPINALAELPTTGFVVAGSTKDLEAAVGTPESTGSIFVASLDAIGRPLWAKSYRLPNNRSIAFAGLRLTNDGGVVVSGVAEHAGAPGGGLWTMKAFAKDGDLGSAAADAGITVTPLSIASPTCAVTTVPWAVTVADGTAALAPVATLAEDAGVR